VNIGINCERASCDFYARNTWYYQNLPTGLYYKEVMMINPQYIGSQLPANIITTMNIQPQLANGLYRFTGYATVATPYTIIVEKDPTSSEATLKIDLLSNSPEPITTITQNITLTKTVTTTITHTIPKTNTVTKTITKTVKQPVTTTFTTTVYKQIQHANPTIHVKNYTILTKITYITNTTLTTTTITLTQTTIQTTLTETKIVDKPIYLVPSNPLLIAGIIIASSILLGAVISGKR